MSKKGRKKKERPSKAPMVNKGPKTKDPRKQPSRQPQVAPQ